jgi:hypothetical protein
MKARVCDICGRPADIKAKLYLAPVNGSLKITSSSYTASMDVGSCCIENVVKLGKWQARNKWPKGRRGDTVGKSEGSAKK